MSTTDELPFPGAAGSQVGAESGQASRFNSGPTPTTPPRLAFIVTIPGTPTGQGSMVNGHHGASTTRHRKLAIEILRDHADTQPHRGPVVVAAAMFYARPANHYLPANTRRPARQLREDAPRWHTGARDVDKCIRLLGDALTLAGVLADDGQIVAWSASKHWTEQQPHTLLEVTDA